MEVTQAEACRILARTGLHRPAAVGLLRCGFAGPARRVGGGDVLPGKLLYREPRVWDLVTRPWRFAREPTTPAEPGASLVICSRPRRPDARSACGWSGVDLLAPAEEQLEAVSRTRQMALSSYAQACLERQARGHIQLLVTVGSFVALGADIVAIDVRDGRTVLSLLPPGDWFAPFDGARVETGLGAERRWLVLETGARLTRRTP